jgi:hypothetical protein
VFAAGLDHGLTEGDLICIFSQYVDFHTSHCLLLSLMFCICCMSSRQVWRDCGLQPGS